MPFSRLIEKVKEASIEWIGALDALLKIKKDHVSSMCTNKDSNYAQIYYLIVERDKTYNILL
jgi:hypothetical protein